MNAKPESDKPATPASVDPSPTNAEVEKLLEHNQKLNTSGLSWDEVTGMEKDDWRQITEMGEGD